MDDLESFLPPVSQQTGTAGRLRLSEQSCHNVGCDEKNNEDHFRNISLLAV